MRTPSFPQPRAILVALTFGAAALPGCDREDAPPEPATAEASAAAGDGMIVPQPLAYAGFPVDSATILGWVAAVDTVRIRQHAWELWAGLTAMTGQVSGGDSLPVYETWLSRFEVYNPALAGEGGALRARGRQLDRGFHSPVQFHHPGAVAATATTGWQEERLVAGVKYDMSSAEHVWTHDYVDSTRLSALNDSFPATPIDARNIVPFPNTAVATKPVYWVVSRTEMTVMPYWAGVDASTDPAQPTPSTWTQFVVVDPTGTRVGQTVDVSANGTTYPSEVIGLDRLYSFALTQDEVDAVLSTDPASDVEFATDSVEVLVIRGDSTVQEMRQVGVGDRAALVAMHVATKEIGNWTWQTFWWTPDPDDDPLSRDKPAAVTGPFRSFAMQQAYYMTVPSGPAQGEDQVTFNPYLETAFANVGTTSNCMSCHQTATWPGARYIFSGDVNPGGPDFAGQLKLDFLWSVQAGASTQQAALQRRIATARRAP
jgi:hypothetical protein